MKFRFFILLLFFTGTAYADDGKEQSLDNQSKQKNDTIWLEEKISPTTTWIENLVQPLTTWMEQKINEPEQGVDGEESALGVNGKIKEEPNATSSNDVTFNGPIISSEKASALAKEHIAGDVLYIKLMSSTKQYRVKLISELGEVHILYIKAISGEIVAPNDKAEFKPLKEITKEDESTANTTSDLGSEHEEKP